jgi:hypothetical protein
MSLYDFALHLELGGELLEQEEDNRGVAERKRENRSLDSVLSSREGKVVWQYD